MSKLFTIRRPDVALITAVEAVGIVLGVPPTLTKSAYKVPAPSNYDDTVTLLRDRFSEVIMQLAMLESRGIPNSIATELYSKLQKSPFDYEAAVNCGGLDARDLLNIIMHIIDKLMADKNRLPLANTNILAIVDGSRSAYVALDSAAHMHQHGTLDIVALSYSDEDSFIATNLTDDLARRCKQHYKIDQQFFSIHSMMSSNYDDIISFVQSLYQSRGCGYVAIGIDASSAFEHDLAIALTYASWSIPPRILLTKSYARTCEFSQVQTPRRFQVCVKRLQDVEILFQAASVVINPEDTVFFTYLADSNDPIGDARDTRFGFGQRYNKWAQVRNTSPETEPDRPDWNRNIVETIRSRMEEVLAEAHLIGSVVIETRRQSQTIAQQLCDIAFDARTDVIVMRRGEMTKECIERANCNIIVVV